MTHYIPASDKSQNIEKKNYAGRKTLPASIKET